KIKPKLDRKAELIEKITSNIRENLAAPIVLHIPSQNGSAPADPLPYKRIIKSFEVSDDVPNPVDRVTDVFLSAERESKPANTSTKKYHLVPDNNLNFTTCIIQRAHRLSPGKYF